MRKIWNDFEIIFISDQNTFILKSPWVPLTNMLMNEEMLYMELLY